MPRSQSASQGQFATVPGPNVPRSVFDRSSKHLVTFDAGYLVPIFVDEGLPADTMSLNMTTAFRLATPVKPIMSDLVMDIHFWSVPNRILFLAWRQLCGEQVNPGDDVSSVEVPIMAEPASVGALVGSLSDYLGVPTGIADLVHSALFHRAYIKIFDDFYRDENLIDSVIQSVAWYGLGPDDPDDFPLKRRGRRHDYFTSCLPWPQKGASVTIPIGTVAPVVSAGDGIFTWKQTPSGSETTVQSVGGPGTALRFGTTQTGVVDMEWFTTALEADLSAATAATINQLREASAIQRLLEKDARGGTRYTEVLQNHFGVTIPDLAFRPEYLGGGSVWVSTHEVPQTTSTDATTPQGNLAAYGTGHGSGIGFTHSFNEHSIVLGIACLRAEDTHIYQQGLARHMTRLTRWDFYWPELANLGEQAVLNKEIYAQQDGNDDLVFGYQERWAEYRYRPSTISGQFRSTFAQTLDIWHVAPEYTALPVLGETFIEENPPIDRVIATPAEPHIIMDCQFNIKHARPMPTRSVPGYTARF